MSKWFNSTGSGQCGWEKGERIRQMVHPSNIQVTCWSPRQYVTVLRVMRLLPTKMENKLRWKLLFIWLVITRSLTSSSRTQDVLSTAKNMGTAINHVAGNFTKGKLMIFKFWFSRSKELVLLFAVMISQVSLFFCDSWSFLFDGKLTEANLYTTIFRLPKRLGRK